MIRAEVAVITNSRASSYRQKFRQRGGALLSPRCGRLFFAPSTFTGFDSLLGRKLSWRQRLSPARAHILQSKTTKRKKAIKERCDQIIHHPKSILIPALIKDKLPGQQEQPQAPRQ
jgi:hypothetical protein